MTVLTERPTPATEVQGEYGLYPENTSAVEATDFDPYCLNDEQLDTIESQIVEGVRNAGYDNQIVTVLVRGDDERANFGRTYEQRTFDAVGENYDFGKNYGKYEDHSLFLYTVDAELGAIAHSKRLVMAKTLEEMDETGLTGIEMLDDRINAKDSIENANMHDLLASDNTSVEQIAGRTMNVATNLTTQRAPLSMAKPYSLISYKGVFSVAKVAGAEQLFVYQNSQAIKSLGKLGVESHLLGGREYHLPLASADPEEMETYDENYVALVIPNSAHNNAAFVNTESKNPMVAAVGRMAVPVLAI